MPFKVSPLMGLAGWDGRRSMDGFRLRLHPSLQNLRHYVAAGQRHVAVVFHENIASVARRQNTRGVQNNHSAAARQPVVNLFHATKNVYRSAHTATQRRIAIETACGEHA